MSGARTVEMAPFELVHGDAAGVKHALSPGLKISVLPDAGESVRLQHRNAIKMAGSDGPSGHRRCLMITIDKPAGRLRIYFENGRMFITSQDVYL